LDEFDIVKDHGKKGSKSDDHCERERDHAGGDVVDALGFLILQSGHLVADIEDAGGAKYSQLEDGNDDHDSGCCFSDHLKRL